MGIVKTPSGSPWATPDTWKGDPTTGFYGRDRGNVPEASPINQLANIPDVSGVNRHSVLQYAKVLQGMPSQYANKDGSSKTVFPQFPLGDTKTLYTEMQKLADEMGPQSNAGKYAEWMKLKYGKLLGIEGEQNGPNYSIPQKI